jgi:hypothetical protein
MVNQVERNGLIRAKLDRAQRHIRDLEVEVATFMETKPYTVGVRTEHQRNRLLSCEAGGNPSQRAGNYRGRSF